MSSSSEISQVSLLDGKYRTLARRSASLGGVVANEDAVYWEESAADDSSEALMRLPR